MNIGSTLSVFSSVPIDWLILAVFFVVIAADALRSGFSRAAAFSVSLPISLLLFDEIPKTFLLGSLLSPFSAPIEQAVLFAILEALLFVAFYQFLSSFEHYTSLLSATVCGIAATVVLIVVWIQVPALQSLWYINPQIQAVFAESYRFFWLLAAYLGLAFIGG